MSKRLLIADDDNIYTRIIMRHLLAQNYEIVAKADDCEQAIKLFKSENPDLTLLDFEMLNVNGTRILQEKITQNPEEGISRLCNYSWIRELNVSFIDIIPDHQPSEKIGWVIMESRKKWEYSETENILHSETSIAY
jgi:CheY-like chemotaxis protein